MNETRILKEMPKNIAGQTYRDLRAALSTTELDALDILKLEVNKKSLKEITTASSNTYEIKASDYLNKFVKLNTKESMTEENVYIHLLNGFKALYKYNINPVIEEGVLNIRIIDTFLLNEAEKKISLVLSSAMQLILKTQQEKENKNEDEETTLQFKNAYAKKLYPMLLPYKEKEKRKDSIASLKRKLGINENVSSIQTLSYIEKAINEINRESNIHVKIKPDKKDNDVKEVTFTVLTRINKPQNKINNKKPAIKSEELNKEPLDNIKNITQEAKEDE